MLRELLGSEPDLDAPAETLPLSERQACAVARALLRDPDVLILDEATSALDVATRERLFGILGRLARTGKSVVFISHRMDEVEEIGDAITVLRAGETVATVRRGESSSRELVALMTGAEHLPERRLLGDGGARIRSQGEPLLAARGLVLRPGAVPVDATIRPGELVGVAGLEGHGQERFLHALAGARPAGGDVLVSTSNGPMALRSRRQATQHGVAYLPRDRQSSGVFEALSVRDNFGLPTLPADRRAGFVSNARTGRRLADYVARLRITLADSRREITTLSGGNQQKVVLARWLAVRPRALLLNDPTRGIDPGAKHDLYELFAGLAREGVAIVMLSTDLDELLDLMDRVLVFREGEIFAELPRSGLTRNALVASFFGRRDGADG
jgi:ABC-type sugar transport system ATPase subunit